MSDRPIHQDDLDDLLHQQLHGFEPEAPEHLWAQIETQIEDKRRKSVLFWWITGLGLLVVLILGLIKIQGKKQNADVASKELAAQEAPQSRPDRLPSHITSAPSKNENFLSNQSAGKPFKNPALRPVSHLQPAEKTPEIAILSARLGVPQPEFSTTIPHLASNQAITTPIPSLFPALLTPAAPELFIPNFPYTQTRQNRMSIRAQGDLLWTVSNKATGTHQHSSQTPDFSEMITTPVRGWQSGVSLKYDLTQRWSVEAGLFCRKEALQTSHTATLQLMDGICLNPADSGAKNYQFQYAIGSVANRVDVTLHISQVDSSVTMPQNEPFSLYMQMTRKSRSWTIPLQLQRNFAWGRWQASLGSGLSLNYLSRSTVQVEHFNEVCSDLCFSTGRLPSVTAQVQKHWSSQFLIQAGLNYRVSRHWSFGVQPAFYLRKDGSMLATGAHFDYHF